jgi:hypothetical protein
LANGLGDLYRLTDGTAGRASSAAADWQNDNGDAHTLPVGVTRNVADIHGPGIIRHVWFTFYGHGPKQGRDLVLRMYWDGRGEPAVESPVGDFFAVGHGAWRTVDSIPVSVSAEGRAYNCYWPMPFAKHARITITNESKHHAGVFWHVDHQKVKSLPDDTAYFHAQYSQEYPAKTGDDYLILDAVGRGRYVGTVYSVQFCSTDWFGEGDDRFFIDGSEEPVLRGTGTEDYFGDAWGFRAFNHPYRGVTLWDGEVVGGRVTAYRWHITDPVPFDKSLRVTMEHKGVVRDANGRKVTSFHERPDFISSVAFWYQTGKAKRFAELPQTDQRSVPYVFVQFDDPDTVETRSAGVIVKRRGGTYVGNRQLIAQFERPGGKLIIPFTLDRPIKGVARLHLNTGPDNGVWSVTLDGQRPIRRNRIDLFKETVEPVELWLGEVDLRAGKHTLTFTSTGTNPAAMACHLSVAGIMVEEIRQFVVEPKGNPDG